MKKSELEAVSAERDQYKEGLLKLDQMLEGIYRSPEPLSIEEIVRRFGVMWYLTRLALYGLDSALETWNLLCASDEALTGGPDNQQGKPDGGHREHNTDGNAGN